MTDDTDQTTPVDTSFHTAAGGKPTLDGALTDDELPAASGGSSVYRMGNPRVDSTQIILR